MSTGILITKKEQPFLCDKLMECCCKQFKPSRGGGGGGTRFFPHKIPVYLKCTWNNLETEYHIPKKICQGTETPSLPRSRF